MTLQQESETSTLAHKPTQEPTQNNHLSNIEEETQTQRLTHVKKNVGAVRATMERMKTTMMHLTQYVNSPSPQKPEDQPGQSNRHETHKPRQTNDQHRQRAERSSQDSVSTSTRRNEMTSG